MKSPAAGMNVSSVPAMTPGARERQRHAQEGLRAGRVQVLGRLDQPLVDLLQCHVERERHEGQEVVGDARDHRGRGGEQPPVVGHEPERLHDADDESVVREDVLPGQRPDQVRDEERGDDEEQEQVLPAPAAERDPVGQRVRDEEREDRGDPRVLERADELLLVGAEGLRVVLPGPGERVPDAHRPLLQRRVPEVVERDDEEEEQEGDPRSQQQVRGQPAVSMEEAHASRVATRRSRPATAPGTRGSRSPRR